MQDSKTKMNVKFYNNKNRIFLLGMFFTLIGIIMAYFYWGVEPQETIAGVFCGLGFGSFLLFFTLKKPTD